MFEGITSARGASILLCPWAEPYEAPTETIRDQIGHSLRVRNLLKTRTVVVVAAICQIIGGQGGVILGQGS